MTNGGQTPPPEVPEAPRGPKAMRDPSPAREMSLHLLRMLETRMDAAGIALQGETQLLLRRLQLRLFAAAAVFIAIWGGIVLLAIALPPHLRVPVLAAVVVGFVILAVVAQLRALGATVATGRFGARMRVSLTNDGPFTVLLEM